jgi:hypothetical protein
MKYNHDRPLSEFDQQLSLIRDAGFKPIAVSQMCLEDTFVFKTPKEAEKAYRMLERNTKEKWIGKVVGWWYGEQDFKQEVKKYERENDGYSKVLVHWL